jgi:hypothetical protein
MKIVRILALFSVIVSSIFFVACNATINQVAQSKIESQAVAKYEYKQELKSTYYETGNSCTFAGQP